jgi:hypothetical protein
MRASGSLNGEMTAENTRALSHSGEADRVPRVDDLWIETNAVVFDFHSERLIGR